MPRAKAKSGEIDQPMRSSGRSKRVVGSFLSYLSAEIKICGLDPAGALTHPRSLTYNNNNNIIRLHNHLFKGEAKTL